MSVNNSPSKVSNLGTAGWLGVAGVVALVVLTGLAASSGLWKVVGIAWVAFAAMALAAPLGARAADTQQARALVWGYGLASGAMITSAAVFLLPQAMAHGAESAFGPAIGGFGVAFGILAGFATHTVGHRLTHHEGLDHTAIELVAHSFAAGAIIGLVYATQPDLGPLLGLAIVSHKGPAGYAAARRLASENEPVAILLLPAAGIGIMAILGALVNPPSDPAINALVFGFASGVFLHLAMDFLPRCELGSEAYEVAHATEDAHALLDRLRVHAVASTGLGAIVVFAAWLVVT